MRIGLCADKKDDLQKYVDFIQKNNTNFELKEKIP